MSDELKRRWSWGWIGWALVVVFVLYPLSAGPLAWYYHHRLIGAPAGDVLYRACGVIYFPLGWLTQHSTWARRERCERIRPPSIP